MRNARLDQFDQIISNCCSIQASFSSDHWVVEERREMWPLQQDPPMTHKHQWWYAVHVSLWKLAGGVCLEIEGCTSLEKVKLSPLKSPTHFQLVFTLFSLPAWSQLVIDDTCWSCAFQGFRSCYPWSPILVPSTTLSHDSPLVSPHLNYEYLKQHNYHQPNSPLRTYTVQFESS